jgi:hypothetical protein
MSRTRAVIATLAALFTTQAMGGDWTPHTFRVKNQNCVWQGLRRTNEVKIHVWQRSAYTRPNIPGPFNQLPTNCADTWVTIHVGQTAAVKVDSYCKTPLTSIPALHSNAPTKSSRKAYGRSFTAATGKCWERKTTISPANCNVADFAGAVRTSERSLASTSPTRRNRSRLDRQQPGPSA